MTVISVRYFSLQGYFLNIFTKIVNPLKNRTNFWYHLSDPDKLFNVNPAGIATFGLSDFERKKLVNF